MLPSPLSFLINLFSNYRPRTAASGRGSRESHKAYSKCSAFTTSAWPPKTKALNSSEIHPSSFLARPPAAWLQCLALAPWKRSESVFCLIPCQRGRHSCILELGISGLTYTLFLVIVTFYLTIVNLHLTVRLCILYLSQLQLYISVASLYLKIVTLYLNFDWIFSKLQFFISQLTLCLSFQLPLYISEFWLYISKLHLYLTVLTKSQLWLYISQLSAAILNSNLIYQSFVFISQSSDFIR